MLTKKQTKTLVLWAQNYTMHNIATKMKVSVSTIKTRLKQIKKSHFKEFENTQSLRDAHKKLKLEIKSTKTFTEMSLSNDGNSFQSKNGYPDKFMTIVTKHINGREIR